MIGVVTFLAVCLLAPPVFADPLTPEQRAQIVQVIREALTQDPSILRDTIVGMQADDARRQNQGAHAAISANHDRLIDQADPVAENPNGDVTIVEVFDPLCPYCRGLGTAMAQVNKEDRGARLIYKDLPILGPPSVLGPRAPIAAQRQGAYAKLRDTLMDAPGCRQAVSIILPR